MMKWIEEVWIPAVQGCRMLILDCLRVHKMESVKQHLEDICCTKAQYIPPAITGLSQPMDVSIMRSSKINPQEDEFSRNASRRRMLLSYYW
ncbi:hypothetical protein PC110_g2568 [Phytophthora cactorum]|uniref:DDE-1 domain-containing protein n=1 Tax=Phytophthora cactorum TaxID=29920 RepID=A0A329SXC9_9STRA|nr:hypothetical protein PC110_g2568 [Phytophthora cactorum]